VPSIQDWTVLRTLKEFHTLEIAARLTSTADLVKRTPSATVTFVASVESRTTTLPVVPAAMVYVPRRAHTPPVPDAWLTGGGDVVPALEVTV